MRVVRIDALRAAAVLLVVVAHSGFNKVPGGYGVTLFFVISGFVITSLILDEYQKTLNFNWRNFAIRRLLKIAPPLIGIVVLPTLILWQELKVDINAFFYQIFFIFNWLKIKESAESVLPGSEVVWSLSIEEQFYFLFALTWLLLFKKQNAILLLFILSLCTWTTSTALRIFFSYSDSPHDETGNLPRIYYGSDTRASAIIIGIILSIVMKTNFLHHNLDGIKTFISSRVAFVSSLLLLTLSFVLRQEFFRDTFRFTVQEICSAVLVAGALNKDCWPRIVTWITDCKMTKLLGTASYSIYLAHLIVIKFLVEINPFSNLSLNCLNALIAVLIGISSHFIFDKPFEKFRKKFRTSSLQQKD